MTGAGGGPTTGVVVSRADEASVAIGERLLELVEWEERADDALPDGEGGGRYYVHDDFELREFDGLHLHLEGVADAFAEPDLVVFVSKHAGETGPLLTAHSTGNVGPADHGGRPNELARAAPNALAAAVESLAIHAPEGYDVGMECTHHGPSRVGAPSMFVEVGSGEEEWRDPAAADAVARAVLDLAGVAPRTERTVVGFGGGHYAPRFERIVRETDWAVGHVVADWAIEAAGGLPPEVIDLAFERSGATRAVVDGDRAALVEAIRDRGYEVASETWVRATDGVPTDVVERAEAALCPVADGLRFGELGSSDPVVEAVNPDLVRAAIGVDRERTKRAIERHVVAYETEEAGNRPTGRFVVPAGAGVEGVVDAIVSVLGAEGAEVRREGEELVVVESSFDPEAARELGVPEGPAFGRLAAGEAVEVDGETVEPGDVHAVRTRRYAIRPGAD